MKNILIGIGCAAIVIAILPVIRDRVGALGRSAPAAPIPAATSASKYRSPLGTAGGLSSASLTLGPASSNQIYTLKTLRDLEDQRHSGQVVRVRISRPTYSASLPDRGFCVITFMDKDMDILEGTKITFPEEGAVRLDLLERQSRSNLTFYVALDPTGLRAVGRDWREDLQAFVW